MTIVDDGVPLTDFVDIDDDDAPLNDFEALVLENAPSSAMPQTGITDLSTPLISGLILSTLVVTAVSRAIHRFRKVENEEQG